MAWIKILEYSEAEGRLLNLYEQCKNPDGSIDRVLKIHSLRPLTLHAHLFLYKAVLHSKPNELSYRERELVGTYTSHLNGCEYCVQHHQAGLGRHLKDQHLAEELVQNATKSKSTQVLSDREKVFLAYAEKLTLHPMEMKESDIQSLRAIGLSDPGVLDLNQIICYFNYVNRMVNGLGVEIGDETLGFHPSSDQEGFGHN